MFLARRIVICASEDVGLANPQALVIANSAMQAVHMVGMPEARIILSEAAIYVALSKKSNASYLAINKALEDCGDGDLIRIILTGYFDENTDKFLSSLEASYANFFYFEIQDNSKLKIDFGKIRNEKLSFKAEFLTIVEQSNESEEDKNKIMQLGIEALKGDDLSI